MLLQLLSKKCQLMKRVENSKEGNAHYTFYFSHFIDAARLEILIEILFYLQNLHTCLL